LESSTEVEDGTAAESVDVALADIAFEEETIAVELASAAEVALSDSSSQSSPSSLWLSVEVTEDAEAVEVAVGAAAAEEITEVVLTAELFSSDSSSQPSSSSP